MNKLTQEELNGLSPRARKALGESNEILQEIVEVNPNADKKEDKPKTTYSYNYSKINENIPPSYTKEIPIKHTEVVELENNINSFCLLKKSDITQEYLKQQYRKLLLQIHPDKCKYNNINCNELCDNLIKHFNSLKIKN